MAKRRTRQRQRKQAWWKRLLPLGFGLGLALWLGGCAHAPQKAEETPERLLKTARLENVSGPSGGFLINDIDRGSVWDRAGLKDGDEIVKADGEPLTGKHSLVKLLGAVAAPGGAELHVLRPNKARGGQVELIVLKAKRLAE